MPPELDPHQSAKRRKSLEAEPAESVILEVLNETDTSCTLIDPKRSAYLPAELAKELDALLPSILHRAFRGEL